MTGIKTFKNILLTYFLISLGILNTTNAQELSLVSYNVRYNNPKDAPNDWDSRKMALLSAIQERHPDFIGTQEVLLNQLQDLSKGLVNHTALGVGRDDGKNKGEFSALFYNPTVWQMLESNTFWLSESPEKVSVGWDAAMERICTYGYFKHKATKKKIWVFNTHFDHIGKIARKASAELIIQTIKRLNIKNEAVVLMGDFNMTPDMEGILEITSYLKDSKLQEGVTFKGSEGTYNGFKNKGPFQNRIDYIFIKNLTPKQMEHIDVTYGPDKQFPSDHFGVGLIVGF